MPSQVYDVTLNYVILRSDGKEFGDEEKFAVLPLVGTNARSRAGRIAVSHYLKQAFADLTEQELVALSDTVIDGLIDGLIDAFEKSPKHNPEEKAVNTAFFELVRALRPKGK